MSAFIMKKFPADVPQIAHISAQVHAGQYDLIRDNGIIIDEDFWDDIIQPGWTVHLKLWPLATMTGGSPEEIELPQNKGISDSPDVDVPPIRISPDENVQPSVEPDQLPPIESYLSKSQDSPTQNTFETSGHNPPKEPENDAATTEPKEKEQDELVICPVCMMFQGDKQSVNYHVNFTHYPPEVEHEQESESESETESEVGIEPPPVPGAATLETQASQTSTGQSNADGETGDTMTGLPRRSRPSRTNNTSKSKPSAFLRWVSGSKGSGSKKRVGQGSGSRSRATT
jgi:hypothetical protein